MVFSKFIPLPKYFELINEVRSLYNEGKIELNETDMDIVSTDLGETVILEDNTEIYLDAPFIEEYVSEDDAEQLNEVLHHGKNVRLNHPFRTPGGPKKFAVYVKTPEGTIKKVTFGDPHLRIKNSNKKRFHLIREGINYHGLVMLFSLL